MERNGRESGFRSKAAGPDGIFTSRRHKLLGGGTSHIHGAPTSAHAETLYLKAAVVSIIPTYMYALSFVPFLETFSQGCKFRKNLPLHIHNPALSN